MKKIIEIIEKRAKELNLRKEDLASIIDLSRQALYAAFYSNESFRVKDLIKLADILKLDLAELFAHELGTKSKKIDYQALSLLPTVLEYKGISELDLIPVLNPGNLTSNLNLEDISYFNLYWFCDNYDIPFDLFIKDEFRKEYKRVDVEDYIQYFDLIYSNNIELKYVENFHYFEIEVVKLINQIIKPDKKKKELKNQTLYLPFDKVYEKLESYFKIAIISEQTNTPLVILTSEPGMEISIINKAEKVAETIFNTHLKKFFKLQEIVWATFQFHSNGSYDIGLVKFTKGKFSGDIEWLDLYNDRYEKEFKIEKVMDFLKYIN